MRFTTLILYVGAALAIAAPAVLAAPSEVKMCGSHEIAPAEVEQAIGNRIAAARLSSGNQRSAAASAAAVSANIPVYYHLITDGTNGRISSSAISNQISILNDNYAGTGLTFYLASTDTTTNSDWFNNVNQGTSQERAMKSALRKGGSNALNVYTVSFGSSGLLGYATFPWSYRSNPSNDGIVLDWQTYPGGPITNYQAGKTLVHEVGHWAGLYHVFQGGCTGSGDYVDDTPPQSTVTRGCPASQDSCAGGGVDSIHSHMDYSYESCRTLFTNGQIARIGAAMDSYRV
ncbi:hypothetical protein EX895_002257 [Sporisorium graminicola]|uniref:Peptidase M43 pregnancy-associated plasma-A domain-containing protein n=1 Tax=Sporisorium graminicola TaxID=280036 RepID=A0A4U7KXH6_9BASI|nr:hypothetical protein EX895_002257 [Sporisorium graminicola]TKY89016.1 hypothetical protein EX895_002257 [Sporisorium graminicola]